MKDQPSNSVTDILILTAVEVEYEMVKKQLINLGEKRDNKTHNYYETGEFEQYQIAIRCTRQGNPLAATEVERAINFTNPQIVFFIGIAGSRNPEKMNIGDVLIVNRVYSYEAGKEQSGGFASREKGGRFSHSLLESAQHEARKKDWLAHTSHQEDKYKVLVGAIASGEKVITNSQSRTAKLINDTAEDALAVDMEGLGFYTSLIAWENTKGLLVRGISDLMDKKDEDYHSGRALAAENATAFVFHLIKKLPIDFFPDRKDKYKDIHNSIIINNSSVSGSFNTTNYPSEKNPIIQNDNRVINTQNYIEKNDGTVNISSSKKEKRNKKNK